MSVLRKMGYRKLPAPPRRHAQAEDAIEDLRLEEIGRESVNPSAKEVWFADKAMP
jgi:hypothetical protein